MTPEENSPSVKKRTEKQTRRNDVEEEEEKRRWRGSYYLGPIIYRALHIGPYIIGPYIGPYI